jgi:hypothetical protein
MANGCPGSSSGVGIGACWADNSTHDGNQRRASVVKTGQGRQ